MTQWSPPVLGLQKLDSLPRSIRQTSALDRFHYYDLFSVLADNLVAFPSLNKLAFPIVIIKRDLYKLRFGVLGQNFIQLLCGAVE